MEFVSEYRLQFLRALTHASTSTSHGLFIDSCYAHCQIVTQDTWLAASSPVLGKKTIGKAVGDWYHDRTPFQKTDCAYPCNPTCKNRVYNSNEQQD
ncbi:pectin acetylesterase 8-like [Prunus yedoensis var. nudiflora]|uniref:Pectin acetylesterase n=1 Tax=Prunus yedoensis var. nudiflora TaxID=2094558 RepID=A0A314YX06_PRUYE|nr:pectin acetylesterase 8-like [Prunus yedoensis var. nudiflora]